MDNLFILNAMLEINNSKKLLSCLLFVDLKEAYDRVDRRILLKKLEAMNFPTVFLQFINSYYNEDYIISILEGECTRKQYQSRGLRQGCNLSSFLFILYVVDLSVLIHDSGYGMKLTPAHILAILLFADNIVLLANTMRELNELKVLLEEWCTANRMKVSVKKTQTITEDTTSQLYLRENDALKQILSVSEYTYLGVSQCKTSILTASARKKAVLQKARMYSHLLVYRQRIGLDTCQVYRALWEQIAVPAILYGCESLVYDEILIQELEKIQRGFAKALLGLNQLTANEVRELEAGLKPMKLRVLTRKLQFLHNHKKGRYVCNMTKLAIAQLS